MSNELLKNMLSIVFDTSISYSTGAMKITDTPIVFFDGVCGLCNRSVNFLLRVDKKRKLRFTPIQGETALAHLPPERRESLDTIIFLHANRLYFRSDAILMILRTLGGFWSVFVMAYMIPRGVRNWLYDWIASHRYRWFGKKESCRLPTPQERASFLP